MLLDLAIERRFLFLLLRNYLIAVLIAVFGIGGVVLFLTLQLFKNRTMLFEIAAISLLVMFIAELITFWAQSQSIRKVFRIGAPDLSQARTSYEYVRKFPIYGVARIMGPHWLGLVVPGVFLLVIARSVGDLDVTNTQLFLVVIASFCVASMHALLEFHLTIRACQPILSHVNLYTKSSYGVDLSLRDDVVVHVRAMYTFSVLLIGVLPLLLFTAISQYRLVYQLHYPAGNMIKWGVAFVIAGILFSLAGALLLSRAVELPVFQLQRGMSHVASGQLDIEIDNIYVDEFARVVAGFNTMVQFLNERDAVNQQLLESFLTVLSTALDARDPYTAGHSVRVAQYAESIARRVGLSTEDIDDIRKAAILHDVGKIGVQDYVLMKNGKLTDEEYAQIKRHPVIGEEILGQIEPQSAIRPLLAGVRSHHERYDGNGYPDGLAGEEIPLFGRLLAVADAFDAMTSDRPYRSGMSVSEAVSIIRDGAGTQWDPTFAMAMVDLASGVDDVESKRQDSDATHLLPLMKGL